MISIPITIISTIDNTARTNMLIKNNKALETLTRIHSIAINKTNTLTHNTPKLTSVHTNNPTATLTLVTTVKHSSKHPLNQTLIRTTNNLNIPQTTTFTTLPNHGITTTVDGHEL